MLSVAEAQSIVRGQVRPLAPVLCAGPLLGLVLAEDVASDLDMPPYDKAMMDGYAVRSADFHAGRAELTVIEEVMAGQVPRRALGSGEATRIMTGAPIPAGCDAVVMVERTEVVRADRVALHDPTLKAGQHLFLRGREMQAGDVVLRAGTRLRPQEIGLLASVGRVRARVYPRPSVAVLATGDELVDPEAMPGPGQIRNSNAAMLCAQVQRAGGTPAPLGIARDDPAALRERIQQGLDHDVLLLSGGVSAGQRDLVPAALTELGVQTHFHQVVMKPGKPILFGTHTGNGVEAPRLVFGLPGNPVSSLIGFELFVRPALRGRMGRDPVASLVDAVLTCDYSYRSSRPTYHPARLHAQATGWAVEPVAWFGSPDLRGVNPADAFVLLPQGEHVHRAGQVFPVLRPDETD